MTVSRQHRTIATDRADEYEGRKKDYIYEVLLLDGDLRELIELSKRADEWAYQRRRATRDADVKPFRDADELANLVTSARRDLDDAVDGYVDEVARGALNEFEQLEAEQ